MENLKFGIDLDQNASYRSYMEDELFINTDKNNKFLLFGLFDGHGGFYVSKKIKEIFPQVFIIHSIKIFYPQHFYQFLENENQINPTNINTKLKECFLSVDQTFENDQQALECGSTGIAGLIFPNPSQPDQLFLSIGNIGDSSAYVFDNKNGYRLSFEHKASDKIEKDRIESSQGQIFFDRVQGILAITRAFGDFSLKKYGVIAEPFLWPQPIELKKQYEFIVIASDGIWDAYPTQQRIIEMANLLQELKNQDCEKIANYFLNAAKQCGSRDNLSIIVIRLQKQ